MTRIENKIQSNKAKIMKLANENIDLEYKRLLASAKRFSDENRNVGTKKNPVIKKLKYMHWFEYFKDESEPDKPIRIERSQIIEIDGERSFHWNKLKYFTETDF